MIFQQVSVHLSALLHVPIYLSVHFTLGNVLDLADVVFCQKRQIEYTAKSGKCNTLTVLHSFNSLQSEE